MGSTRKSACEGTGAVMSAPSQLRNRLLGMRQGDFGRFKTLLSQYHNFRRTIMATDSISTVYRCACGLELTTPDRWWTQHRIEMYEQNGRTL